MKIWPFDIAAEANHGHHISCAELRDALAPFERIRKQVGDRMDVMVEFHSLWNLLPAMKIAQSLAQYGTYWHEDPIKMNSLSSLKRYAEASSAPICASETLGSRWAFRDLLETGVAGIVMLDLGWCGGYPKPGRSPPWPRRGTCPLHRTTVPDRSYSQPRSIFRSMRRMPSFRNPFALSIRGGIKTW